MRSRAWSLAMIVALCAPASGLAEEPAPARGGTTNYQSGTGDLGTVIQALERDNPFEYEAVMRRFVESAQREDIDSMIALTSKITREQAGDEQLRKLYAAQYTQLFKRFPRMSKGGDNTHLDEGKGGPGWIFDKSLSTEDGESSVPLRFVVLKEEGKICVAAVRLNGEPRSNTPPAPSSGTRAR
jgi:hypothetical protein